MKSLREHTANKIFYVIGLVMLFPLVLLILLQNTGMLHLTESLYPCVFRRLSGLYCPGCGGTRAVQALLAGDFIHCFIYHPFVFYCAVFYIVFMGSHTLEMLFHEKKDAETQKKSPHKMPFVRGLDFKEHYVYIGVLIILLQWMLKNLLLICNIR